MFSWSSGVTRRPSGSTTSTYPAQRVAQTVEGSIRPPEYSRSQHIQSYLTDETLKKSTRKVSADDSTYDTVFQTTSGDALILRVHLPSSNGAPQMTLVGVRATHEWLDSRMRVIGYSHIQSDASWQSSGLLLGAAVHQVVQHLQLQPPNLIEITDAGLRRLQANLGTNHVTSSNTSTRRYSSTTSTDAPPDYESIFSIPEMPEIPSNFDDCFQGMSKEDMEQLLEHELDFLTFACTLPEYKKLQELGSSVLDENIETAESNLKEEERLKELHASVSALQTSLQAKLTAFEVLETQQNKLCAPPDKELAMKRLQKAKKQAMDESEEFAEKWIEEGGNVKDFIDEFMEKRKLHHVRAAKIERLQVQK